MKYLKELDGIRAIAALMVMSCHFFQILNLKGGIYYYLNKIAIFGGTGVSLFFVLSGFLITRLLLITKSKNNYFINFYARRALRIFPLYYLFLFIYYFVYPFVYKNSITPFSSQVYYWVYLQNFAITFNWGTDGPAHFWSLAVEEHFYLIWPLVIFVSNSKNIIKIALLIIIFAFLLRIFFIINNLDVFYFTFTRFDELALGSIFSILEFNGQLKKIKTKLFLQLITLIIIPTLILWGFYTGQQNKIVQVIKFNLLSFFYFFTIGYVINMSDDNVIKKLLKMKFFSYSGKISYGLYVYHPLCFIIYNKYFHTEILLDFMLSFILTYLVATFSYFTFENYFLKLKTRFN